MKKIFLITLSLLTLNLASCRCNDNPDIKPDVYEAGVSDVASEDVITDTVISNDMWEITLPALWEQQDKELTSSPGTELIAANKESEAVFVLVSKQTDKSFDQYAIEYIRSIRGAGFAVEYITYSTMNCSRYVVITAIRDGIKGMIWLTVNEDRKISYELSCGGSVGNENSFMSDCNKFAKSFKVQNLSKCHLK